MEETAFINRKLEVLLKTRKWNVALSALFTMYIKEDHIKYQSGVETIISDMPELLPEASMNLNDEGGDWLTLFRRIEDSNYGSIVLGRHKRKTRFVWRDSPFDIAEECLKILGVSNTYSVKPIDIEQESDQVLDVTYSFPLRHNRIVYVRLPQDITREELSRLAEFTKLLPVKG